MAVAVVVQMVAAGAAPAAEVETQTSVGTTSAPATFGLPLGARARFDIGGMHVEGQVSSMDELGVTIMQENGLPYRVGVEAIDGLEVARARPRIQAAFRGALIGAAFGGALQGSLMVGQQQADDGSCTDAMGTPQECQTKAMLAETVALGALTGLVVGVLWPGHHWERVKVNRVRVGVGLAPGGGVAARATVSF